MPVLTLDSFQEECGHHCPSLPLGILDSVSRLNRGAVNEGAVHCGDRAQVEERRGGIVRTAYGASRPGNRWHGHSH